MPYECQHVASVTYIKAFPNSYVFVFIQKTREVSSYLKIEHLSAEGMAYS
jgi:hypothetical protein